MVRSWREYSATVTQCIRHAEGVVQKKIEMKVMRVQLRQFVGEFNLLDAE